MQRCDKQVSDRTGFYFHKCARPARFTISYKDDPSEKFHMCKMHAKRYIPAISIITPIEDHISIIKRIRQAALFAVFAALLFGLALLVRAC